MGRWTSAFKSLRRDQNWGFCSARHIRRMPFSDDYLRRRMARREGLQFSDIETTPIPALLDAQGMTL